MISKLQDSRYWMKMGRTGKKYPAFVGPLALPSPAPRSNISYSQSQPPSNLSPPNTPISQSPNLSPIRPPSLTAFFRATGFALTRRVGIARLSTRSFGYSCGFKGRCNMSSYGVITSSKQDATHDSERAITTAGGPFRYGEL
jgi:hypothetical protein